jgi:hypothetical protein
MMVERLFENSAFRLDLPWIFEVLPLAAAAAAKMRARRVGSSSPGRQHLRDSSPYEVFLALAGTHLHAVSRHCEGDENDLAAVAPQPFASVDELLDFHFKTGG